MAICALVGREEEEVEGGMEGVEEEGESVDVEGGVFERGGIGDLEGEEVEGAVGIVE